MNSFKKILGINLLILLVYSLIIRVLAMSGGGSRENEAALGIAIISAFVVGAHVLISLVISLAKFSSNNREGGRAWLGTTGLVLLIGFSVCLGNTALGT